MSASTGPRCSLASKRRLSCLRVLGVSLLIAATPGMVLAKERLPRVYLGFGAGANLVLSDWDLDETDTAGRPQSAESSALFELRLGLDLLGWLSLEAGAGYLPLSAGEDEVDALHLHASARFPFARDTIEPYLMVGVGAFMNPDGDRGADQDPAVHYGGGVAIGLADWLDLRVEARHLMSDGLEAALSHKLSLTAGLDFQLWRRSDDEPPPEPEPPTPRAPADGDGDGVADGDDTCPDLAGPATLGGCPDGDGDGISDRDDACPRQAGERPDGCPAKVVEPVAPPQEPVSDPRRELADAVQPIQFDSASSETSASVATTLDRVAAVMRKHPELRIRIEGHADSTGEEDLNDALSEARAARVRDQLVQRGVSASRITIVGHGERRPAATNNTAEGRAKNRRVEIGLEN